jgi:alkaline phosphatase D
VVLLTGDRHRADVWKIERTDSYDLYEFQNARLTNIHTHDSVPGALFSYNDTCHFGRLRIDTTKADPTITYDIISIDGEVVHSVTLRRSQLTAA